MLKVSIRGLLARRTRLLLTGLAVALGVTLIAGTYVFSDTINRSFDRIFASSYAGTDVAITPGDELESADGELPPISGDVLRRVQGIDGVDAVEGSIFDQNGTVLDADGDELGSGLSPKFIASAHSAERFEGFEYAEGNAPQRGDQVAIDRSTAKREDLALGDTVYVQGNAPKKAYRIVGITRIAGVDSFGGATIALLTLPEAQRVTAKQDKYDEIKVSAKPGVSADELARRIDQALPGSVDVRTGANEARDQSEDIREDLGFLTTALLAFAGISLFVGAFLIFNTFSITVAQRMRELALLRTLGATRGQVLRSVLGEGLAIGVAGSVIGVGLGVLAAAGIRALFKAIGVEMPSNGTVIETRTVVVSLIVGTVVTLVSALAPALRAMRVPPVAALREGAVLPPGRGHRWVTPIAALLTLAGVALMAAGLFLIDDSGGALSAVGGGAAALFLGIALLSPRLVPPLATLIGRPLERAFGLTGRLARENSVRHPGRTAVTAAALMVGIALVTFASIFAASARETIASAVDRNVLGQVVVQNSDGFSSFSTGASQAVARADGVAATSGTRWTEARVGDEEDDVDVSGVDAATLMAVYDLKLREGSADAVRRLDTRTVVIGRDYAEEHEHAIGDTLTVTTPTSARVDLRVVAIADDDAALASDLIVSNELVTERFGLPRDNLVFVGLEGGADAAAAKRRLSASLEGDYPEVEVLTAEEFKDDQAGQIDQLLGLIYGLLSLAIVVSLFGIVNTLVLSITERTREIGMLRAVGTTRRQIKRMIRAESMITALIGGLLGSALGIALASLVSRPIDDFEFAVPVGSLVIVLILGALAGVLAAIWPARRAARLDVLQALAYE